MNFYQKVEAAVEANNSLVCVGLDPLLEKIPAHLGDGSQAIFEFCKTIVDATHDLVCGYKPQIAYFSGQEADDALQEIVAYIHKQYPDIPIILDSKRGDIGATAQQYAKEAFDRYVADAVTLNPYMGYDSAQPFLDYADKGCIFLCRTSNPGAGDFQDLVSDGQPLYQYVAKTVAKNWNKNNNCCLVVGATAPEQLAEVRKLIGDMLLLVPGIGAQGGDVQATLEAGVTGAGNGLMINASRSIIYAGSGPDFGTAAREATIALRDEINRFR